MRLGCAIFVKNGYSIQYFQFKNARKYALFFASFASLKICECFEVSEFNTYRVITFSSYFIIVIIVIIIIFLIIIVFIIITVSNSSSIVIITINVILELS